MLKDCNEEPVIFKQEIPKIEKRLEKLDEVRKRYLREAELKTKILEARIKPGPGNPLNR